VAEVLSRKVVKRIKGECQHCAAQAVPGSDYCEAHKAKAAEYGNGWARNRRQERADAGECITGCGVKVRRERREDGTWKLQRCEDCAELHSGAMRSLREMRGVETESCGVETKGKIPPVRTARTKLERAYDKLVDGTERMIERTVYRSRGGQSKSSMDADGAQDISDALRLLTGHCDRLRHLRVVEADLGRIHRAEAHAAVADPLVRALGLIAAEAARLSPDGWKLVRTRLMAIGGEDE
jgi:hypothetical protein